MKTQTVDVYSDAGDLASSLAPNAATGYGIQNVNLVSELIVKDSTSTTIFATMLTTFTDGNKYTVAAFGVPSSGSTPAEIFVLNDAHTAPATGNYKARFVNLASANSSVDVYVTTVGGTLTTPTVAALAYGTSSAYVELAAGTWQVRVFPAGSTTSPIYNLNPFTTTSADVRTFIFSNQSSGTTLNSRILAD